MKRNRVATFLKKIYHFDENLKNVHWKFQVQNRSFYVVFVGFIGCLLIGAKSYFVFKFALDSGNFNLSMLESVFNVPFCILTLAHFLLSSLCVLCRMKALNENFKWLQMNHHRELWHVESVEKEKQILKNLTKLYVNLVDAVDEINSVFTIQVKVGKDVKFNNLQF